MSRSGRTMLALPATMAMLLALAAPALAVPAISASPNPIDVSSDVGPGRTLVVSGTGFAAYDGRESDLYVGVCTDRYFAGIAPACGWFDDPSGNRVVPSIDGAGALSATVYAAQHPIANQHAALPGQSAEFDCLTEQSRFTGCEAVVVDHTTLSPTFVATTPLTFQP
jgi:hypothetical protein